MESLGESIIRMYSIAACAALEVSNQDTLSQDLESDPFLNFFLQRFTCTNVISCTSEHWTDYKQPLLSERNIVGTVVFFLT